MDPSEIRPPEVRDLTLAEEAAIDRMNHEIGRLVYGDEWPEARERVSFVPGQLLPAGCTSGCLARGLQR